MAQKQRNQAKTKIKKKKKIKKTYNESFVPKSTNLADPSLAITNQNLIVLRFMKEIRNGRRRAKHTHIS
jgi:hypothetical protein